VQPLSRRLQSAPPQPSPLSPVPVALVITELDVGGAEKALVSLATSLDRSRWQPHVIALGPEGPLATPLRDHGIPTTCLDARLSRPARALVRLAGELRRSRPSLIQSFLFHANLASRLAAPLVAGRPWVLGGLRVAEHEQSWHLALERRTQRLTLGWVCVSEGVRRHAVEVGGLDPERLTVIPNGLDPAPFDAAAPADRASLGVPADAFLTVFVGRFEPQKGLPHLLDASRTVAASLPTYHLLLVGDGPDRPALMAQVASDPVLSNRVHWLGRRDDVPSVLKAADLLALPSLWEGMPNIVLEAMAARRPVVATQVEGTEDLVLPSQTGWLIPPGDPRALAAALLQAAADPAHLRSLGIHARDRVDQQFTLTAATTAYDRLWTAILGHPLPSTELPYPLDPGPIGR
jgi:starch synthase (maltosyl-transferring)